MTMNRQKRLTLKQLKDEFEQLKTDLNSVSEAIAMDNKNHSCIDSDSGRSDCLVFDYDNWYTRTDGQAE